MRRGRQALLGVAGGAFGVLAMNTFMKASARWVRSEPKPGERARPLAIASLRVREKEPATNALARSMYTGLTGREPSTELQRKLGTAVHWGYGLTVAGLYAALRRPPSTPDLLGGALFGLGLWAVGDELMVPALGLSRSPRSFYPSVHVQTAAAHLVYGIGTALSRQQLERLLSRVRDRAEWRERAARQVGSSPRVEPPSRGRVEPAVLQPS